MSEDKKTEQRKNRERIRNFRLMDDDFMAKCFEEDLPCTELVLRIVLDKNDLCVQSVQTQKFIKNLQGRSIRADILATDSRGKKYNIEIQRDDSGVVEKRARYNGSVIDANITNPGDKYEKLPESYVIFITEKDVRGKGLPLYHVDRMIEETGEKFKDELHIVYVNGTYQDDSPLGKLMQDFNCKDPDQMNYEILANRVRYFKEDTEGVKNMCKMLEEMCDEAEQRGISLGISQGISQGIAMGKTINLVYMVCKKLRKSKTPEMIADELEEDITEIERICAAAEEYAPEYDCDRIYEKLERVS